MMKYSSGRFEKTIADYLTFEFNMIMQDKDYLFQNLNNMNLEKKNGKSFDLKSFWNKKGIIIKNCIIWKW